MSIEQQRGALSRRAVLVGAARTLAAIGVVVIGVGPALAKAKAAKEDFYFQEEPGENNKSCENCINFSPKSAGQYGADSGDCGLLEGDVCKHCYCQGWTDKSNPNSKKAGT